MDSTGTTNYAWDFENRLTSVTLPGSSGTVTFKYDPFGRRIYKSSSSGTSVFAYDEDNVIEETNAAGGVVARYSQGLNIDEPLAMLRSATTSYYHGDGIGSVTSLSNGAGALAQTYTLDSFGKQTASSGSLTNPFKYTGRELDSETGLYYYRARYYDPATGRFLSEDPLEFGGGDVDFYAYAFNDPTNFVDPFGLSGTGTLAPPAPPTTGTLPGTGTTGTGTIPGTGAKPVLPAGDGFPWGGFVRGALIELGRELLFPTPTGSNDQPHPGLYNPKCDTGKNHPCYIQYKADERWCREKYINNEALYDYCMLIADVNLERCLDGLPRAPRDPNDPRYIRKRRK